MTSLGGLTCKAVIAALCLLLLQSAYSLIVRASHAQEGTYAYNTRTVVLFAEMLKCLISANMLGMMWTRGEEEQMGKLNLKVALLFSIPGLLYFVNNNIPFFCLKYLDPPSYQVLQQMKIGTTAIAFRLLMGRSLSTQKWASIGLLLVGCALSQMRIDDMSSLFKSSVVGYALVTAQCSISALAAVVSEKLLKETNQSIHLQNLQLYLYGVLFSLINLEVEGVPMAEWHKGYNIWAVLGVICLSFTGLATSAVMKYADNLIKVFALAGSMIFTTVASAVMFGTVITVVFMLGTLIACASCFLYFTEEGWVFEYLEENCGGVCNFGIAKAKEPPVTLPTHSQEMKEPLVPSTAPPPMVK